jgi:hypothetical protein
MEVQGKIKIIGEVQTFGQADKPFLKRELVVVTEDQYPQPIMVEFVQDKCDLLNAYKVGDDVKVSINLRGREWINPQGEAKYFNSIQGWRVEKLESSPTDNLPPTDTFKSDNYVTDQEPDDLPL